MDEVIYHSDSVSSVFLVPDKKIPKFLPGQFLHFTLDEYDPSTGFWPESRVFSIASAPVENRIRITYSVKGRFTKRMYDEIKINNYYWIKMPYGHFNINSDENIVLIAGGTGITPFISFLKSCTDKSNLNVSLFYGIRKRSLFIFEDEILKARGNLPQMKMSLYCEDEEFFLTDELKVKKGLINREEIISTISNSNPTIYMSGPKEMIDSFKGYLIHNGILEERIRLDEWE
ncbi:MAG: ferredoxin--NADP reductase [Myxococcota bacterium]